MRLILVFPIVLIAASTYFGATGAASDSLGLLAVGLMIGVTYWLIFPREYQVYQDHLRIVLGGPFSVRVGFHNVKAIRITGSSSLSVNFVTRITRTYVEIAKKKGISVAITPSAAEPFVEAANRALDRWTQTRSR